jgi:hypothetical protein
MSGKKTFNLLATTLEAILYKTLHKLIGQNLDKFFGFVTFGIRTIMESQKPSGISPPTQKSPNSTAHPFLN